MTSDPRGTSDPLADALLELAAQLSHLVDATRESLDRDVDRRPLVTQTDRLSLVRQFADERLTTVEVDSNPVPVVRVHDAYTQWCVTRRLREDEVLPFTGLMTALRDMGFAQTDLPVQQADGTWSYALVHTRLLGWA